MNYNYRYRLDPTESQRETLEYHRDTCRQLYNHALYRFDQIPEDEGTVKQRVRKIRDELPALKEWWEALTEVYAKVLQPTVMRLAHNITALGELKEQGYEDGQFRWKSPREFRSFTYNQSGFELDEKGGQTVLSLSKLADIPIIIHRPVPDDATVKEVTLKKEPTGEWFAIFGIEMDADPPPKPSLDEIPTDEMVGIDVGILKYAHDTDGTAVDSLDLAAERERLERGSGPSLRLPDAVADRIRGGQELGPVFDDRLGTEGLKKNAGSAGVFTGGAIDRESALVHAIAGAVGPFVTDQYRRLT